MRLATISPLSRAMSEAQLLEAVVELAMALGWRAHHSRPAMDRGGRWKTPIQGHPGLPDLLLTRSGRLIFVELKATRGGLTPGQKAWLADLRQVDGTEVHVWRPQHWLSGEVERVLRGGY